MTDVPECYHTALPLLHSGFGVICIPVTNDEGDRDVAVVALAPTPVVFLSLMHPDLDTRLRALISVARASHELLIEKGLVFTNGS